MRRWTARLLVTLLLLSLAGVSGGAKELPPGWQVPLKQLPAPWDRHWAAETLAVLWSTGFLADADVQQDPDRPLPRGHFAAWISRAAGLAPFRPERPSFADVPADSPLFPWIEALVQAGAVHGYPDGTFQAGRPTARAELAAVLRPFSRRLPVRTQSVGFTDTGGHWAEGDIREVARRGLLTGYPDGRFQPDRVATFAEGATVILRLLAGHADPKAESVRLMLQLQQARQARGLVTVGEMAAVVAQNFFNAPLLSTADSAVNFLQQRRIPVSQNAGDVLQVEELQAWVRALQEQGRLDDLPRLDADPEQKPTGFAVDLQVVRDVLTGTLLPQTEVVQTETGPCYEAINVRQDPQARAITGIPRERAFMVHPEPRNHPPVAAFTVTSPVTAGQPVTYTDLSYDPDGETLVRLWAGNQPSFATPGRYTVSLLVVDPSGAAATVSHEVEVNARPNRPPVAYFRAPGRVRVGEAVTYTVQATDPDGDAIVAERWEGKRAAFVEPGVHTVRLSVQDSRGDWSAPYEVEITVLPLPLPDSEAELSLDPNPARRGQDVELTISCSKYAHRAWVDVPSALEEATVTFGDGESVQVSNPDGWATGSAGKFTHKVTLPWTSARPADGTYPFTVTVDYRHRYSWNHVHDFECRPEDKDCIPPTHKHWETDTWSTTHTADLVIRGQVEVLTPGH